MFIADAAWSQMFVGRYERTAWAEREVKRSVALFTVGQLHIQAKTTIVELGITLFRSQDYFRAKKMLALTISAELNGVTDLQPVDSETTPFYYTFKEQNAQSGSRGEANFVWRCKNCKREHSANIVDTPKAYAQQSPPKPATVITLDCRGLEFVEFKADGEWKADGLESGSKFSGIDLSEGEWFDYDEKASEEVSITSVAWDIRRA